MLYLIRITLIFCLLVCSTLLRAESDKVELYTVNYPPYTIIDEAGNISGIDVEVTKAAFAAVGIDAIIKTEPWKRIYKNVTHGRVAGVLSCSRRPDREAIILFSDPTSEATQVAIAATETDLSELQVFADLKKFSVTSVEGWGIEKELTRAGIEHTTTPDPEGSLRAVVFRDLDIYYSGRLTTLYLARQMGLADKIKVKTFTDKQSTDFHLCLSKQFPGSESLRETFNRGLKMIRENGQFQSIYDRYL
ncbi:substrate-binding periplasmic protein [Neptuniibacter halophilus]|uniref:substrate-binding periplasmic protein n=1 Tax=Neptuniibacter halophilus TaxID=651666 RepID=UPI002572BA85|nr:transporter substrate-binding domain-containing protein [Neptuniibacter halophilus]